MRESWLGGFIHEAEDGMQTYVIRKQVAGRRYEISTRCTTERAALKQLERFEADPANYGPGRDEGTDTRAIYLDQTLALQFLRYSKDVKKNSPSWLYQQRRYVAWWAKQLQGLSLARVTLRDHITPALKDQKARAHRIATIKALYAWLRKIENVLTPAEDPTLDTLMVPQAKPGLRAMKNKTIPADHHHQARTQLEGHWAAGMDVQAGTGWHITEIKRFAEGGGIEAHPNGVVEGVAGVLVCPEAKGGGELRTPVSASVLEAATLLLARGSFDVARYRNAVKEACVDAGVPVFTPGRFRHTVGTAAINNGANPAQVSAFLNHKDPRTLKRFYATHAVVQKIPTLL